MEENQEAINTFCGLCLKTTNTENATEVFIDMIQIVIPDLLPYLNKAGVCDDCNRLVSSIFNFKSTCLEIEDNLYNYKTKNCKELDLEDLVGLRENGFHKNSRICRTCFKVVEDDMYLFVNKNNDSSLQLHQKKCLPELNMELTKQPVICVDCVDMLRSYFNFITRCLDNVERKIKLLEIDKTEASDHQTEISNYELHTEHDIKCENDKDLPNEEYRLNSGIFGKYDKQELCFSDINNGCQVPTNTNEMVVILNDISNIDISQSNELEQNSGKAINEDIISISDSDEDTVEYNLKELSGDSVDNSKELCELENKQTDNNGPILQCNNTTAHNCDYKELREAKDSHTDDNQPILECNDTARVVTNEDTVKYNVQDIEENSFIRELSKPENKSTDNKLTLVCRSPTVADKNTLTDNQIIDSVKDKATDNDITKLVSEFNQIFNTSIQIDSIKEVTKNYSEEEGRDDIEIDLECVRNVSTVTSEQTENDLKQSSILTNNNSKYSYANSLSTNVDARDKTDIGDKNLETRFSSDEDTNRYANGIKEIIEDLSLDEDSNVGNAHANSLSENVDARDKTDIVDKNLEIGFSSDEDTNRYANDIEEIIEDLSLDEDSNVDNALSKSKTSNKEECREISNTCDSDILCDVESVHATSENFHNKYDSNIENGGQDDVEIDLECVRNIGTVTSEQAESNLKQSSVPKNNNSKHPLLNNIDARDKTDVDEENVEIESSSVEDTSRFDNDIEEIIEDLPLDEDCNIDNALTKSTTSNNEKCREISNTCDSVFQSDIESIRTNSSEKVQNKCDSDIEIIEPAETQNESYSQNHNSDHRNHSYNTRSNRESKTKRKLTDVIPEISSGSDSDFQINSDNDSSDSEEYSENSKKFKMSNPLSNKYLYCAYCRYTCTVQMHMEEHMNKCKNVRLVKMQTYSKNKKSTPNTLKTTIVAAPTNLVPSQQVDSHSRIMNRLLLYLIRKNPVTVGETSSLFSAIPNRTSGIYLQPNNTTEKHQSKESTHVIILSDDETPIEPVNKVYEEPNNLVIVNEDAKMDKELVKQLDIDSLAVDTENKRAGNECNDVNMQIGSRNEAKRLSDSNTNIVSNLLLPSCQKTNNAIRMMSVENYLYKNGQIENEFNAVNVQMGSSNEAERLSDSNINNVSNLLFKSCQNSNNAIGLVSLENDDPCKNGEITDTEIPNVAPAESTTHDADTNKITTTTDTEINSVMKDLASVLTDSSLNNETTENTNNLNRDLPWQNSVVVCSCGSRVTEVCHSIIEINEGSKCNIKNFPGDLNKLPMSEKSIAKDKVVISGDHSLMNIQIQKIVASSKLALNTQNCSGDLNKLPMSETSIAKDKATSEDTTLIDIQKTSTSSKLIRQLLTDKRCVFLADHLVDQKILTIYKCDSCNFNTRYLKLLDSHIIDHFCQMANSKYTCNKCRAHLSDKRDVIEHVKKLQHGYTIGVWCVNCSSIFLKTWEARKHQKVCPRKQISVKLFRSNNVIFCMLCQYETSDLAQAKEHTKIHKERVMNTRQVIEVD
ncbi:probable serine/threonine-protein kinase DDB_G0282963 isoform X2 [Diabrotica virgifera virgifera]|uniref:C2H2-type domain-containing protein n=1 Tax=Diabrotica virgifera virgifera TaxID=50390 RepID=A0ABM5KBC7_DIAVI|nr:probable serine/threonine-protein kinase DDB_G0282963 isoform X2 [Diabrotica virgifera virgifera]